MKVQQQEATAIVGISVNITTQEQIVLANAASTLSESLKKARTGSVVRDVRLDPDTARNILVFLQKLTQDVPSMQEAYEDLFNINSKESIYEFIGKLQVTIN